MPLRLRQKVQKLSWKVTFDRQPYLGTLRILVKTIPMRTFILFLCFTATSFGAFAQTVTFKAGTGDKELDVSLSDLNASAKLDLPGFKAEMNLSFNCGNQKIDELLVKMQPGDVFMVLQIANLAKKDMDKIVAAWEKKRGWGQIAKDMGIKPGSPEFHTMKKNAKDKKDKMKERGKSKGNNGNGADKGKKGK